MDATPQALLACPPMRRLLGSLRELGGSHASPFDELGVVASFLRCSCPSR